MDRGDDEFGYFDSNQYEEDPEPDIDEDEERDSDEEDDDDDEDIIISVTKEAKKTILKIGDPNRKPGRKLTLYERDTLLAFRSRQLDQGYRSFLSEDEARNINLPAIKNGISDIEEITKGDSMLIARQEYELNLLDRLFTIQTDLKNGIIEEWGLFELQKPID